MKTIKVVDATNQQLNYLAAMALGANGVRWHTYRTIAPEPAVLMVEWEFGRIELADLDYCNDWELTGQIIEREGLHLRKSGCEWQGDYWNEEKLNFDTSYGPTPLIAVMRCFVTSKFGKVVDIPEDL